MKITVSELRKVIAEVMKDPSDGEELALLIHHEAGSFVELVLYRPTGMSHLTVEQIKATKGADHVVASIEVHRSNLPDASKFYEVQSVAASPGWGPFMYDKAMALTGGLMPDRFIVSDSAKKIWSYYYHQRPDIKKEPLENVRLHRNNDVVLNHGYSLAGSGPDTQALENRHAQFVAEIASRKLGTEHAINRALRAAGDRFFVEHKRRLGK